VGHAFPDRFIPLGITFLTDAEKGAAEIRRNAKRGFKAVTIPEQPHNLGLAFGVRGALGADHPCVRRDRNGAVAARRLLGVRKDAVGCADDRARRDEVRADGDRHVCRVAVERLAGEVSELKIAIAGVGHRLGRDARRPPRQHHDALGLRLGWPDKQNPPSTVLRRNFWFCMIDDPSTISTLDKIGVDHVVAESDYPHGDGTWPDTQAVMQRLLGDLPVDWIRKITHENAAKLYRHPLPSVCRP
jgi:predicted TIM-barrel fold metal-dependent hydrolase